MKKIKNEKGAITIITLVTILFMVSFLISAYIIISNKVKAQKEMIAETRNVYESKKTMEEIYNSYIANNEIIPIYTTSQLTEIGKGKTIEINGKFYVFSNDATYILMNDLRYSGNVISKSFEGGFEGNRTYNNISKSSTRRMCMQ